MKNPLNTLIIQVHACREPLIVIFALPLPWPFGTRKALFLLLFRSKFIFYRIDCDLGGTRGLELGHS